MKIKVVGIDHRAASVGVREKFAFTTTMAASAMKKLKVQEGVSGCVLLSTCNRMELWVSYTESTPDLAGFIAEQKNISESDAKKYLFELEEYEAVRHLFYMAGGLESLIMGDGQILTQIKASIALARDVEAADRFLEVLFRMAVTAGKKVCTNVNFDKGNRSAAALAVEFLGQEGYHFENAVCLVIGNGEMGKIAAQTLAEAGACVTVTVRQYRSGMVCIPKGCKRINYGERYDILPDCDFVFSATSSPNLTITKERLSQCSLKGSVVFADLAVPRDIDSGIDTLAGVKRYDIDSLKISEVSEEQQLQRQQAEEILNREIEGFFAEQSGRINLNAIQDIGMHAGEETAWRMKKGIKGLSCNAEERDYVSELVAANSDRVTQKLLFALQKELSFEEFSRCLDILKRRF